jgi:predicted secreted protein
MRPVRRLPAASALLLAFLLPGCRCAWEGRNVWLATDASQGKTLEARVGDELLLELAVEPGSGARWFFAEIDESVLRRKGPAEEQPGGRAVRIPFHARRPGVTDLVAFRAAARDAPPEKTFRTTVWVR